jgi:hypothetical protein
VAIRGIIIEHLNAQRLWRQPDAVSGAHEQGSCTSASQAAGDSESSQQSARRA